MQNKNYIFEKIIRMKTERSTFFIEIMIKILIENLGRQWKDGKLKLFLEAMLYMNENGCKWRGLPEKYGKWNSVFRMFSRWRDAHIFQKAFKILKQQYPEYSEFEIVFIDSSHAKATKGSNSHCKKNSKSNKIGRNKGGNNTKLCVTVGNEYTVVDVMLLAGNEHDIKSKKLTKNLKNKDIVADKAFNSKEYEEELSLQKCKLVSPSKKNAKNKKIIDETKYKKRNKVERFFCKYKEFGRVRERHEKTEKSYLAFAYFTFFIIFTQQLPII